MRWKIKRFDNLSLKELYNILALRQEVFVVEQDCPYLDADNKDDSSWHICGFQEDLGSLIAYARVVDAGVSYPEISIGRVLTHQRFRSQGLGITLMLKCINFIEESLSPQPIRISAQSHLHQFYHNLGFRKTGKEYLEDGIPHMEMLRP